MCLKYMFQNSSIAFQFNYKDKRLIVRFLKLPGYSQDE